MTVPMQQQATTRVENRRASHGLSWPMIAGLSVAIAAAAYTGITRVGSHSIETTDYVARTDQILNTTPLIDGHNDLPYLLRLELQNRIYDNKTFTFSQGSSKLLPHMKRSHGTEAEQALRVTQTSNV